MKRSEIQSSIWAIVLLAGTILALSANYAFAALLLDDYYPTNQGSSWSYQVTGVDEDGNPFNRTENSYINGYETVSYPGGNQYTGFIWWDDNGTGTYNSYDVIRITQNGEETIRSVEDTGNYILFGTLGGLMPNQPAVGFPKMFDIGMQGDVSSKVYYYLPDGSPVLSEPVSMIGHYSIDEIVSMSVPAGTFNDVVKSTVNMTAQYPGMGEVGSTTYTYYTAKGVGDIKWSAFSTIWGSSSSESAELLSYAIVPEPSSLLLFGIGLLGARALRKKRKS